MDELTISVYQMVEPAEGEWLTAPEAPRMAARTAQTAATHRLPLRLHRQMMRTLPGTSFAGAAFALGITGLSEGDRAADRNCGEGWWMALGGDC